MELGLSNTLLTSDPRLVDHIVGEVKSQGIFDQFRKECIADVDTKPAYQNLRTRVEGSVNSFLSKQIWKPDLNKNQLRETLRKHIHEAPYLDAGVERIVDQVVNPKVYSVFMSQIEDVVYKFLGLERPKAKEKYGVCGLKDLLPKDLDPVSPESEKNSLKDVSLESVDAMEGLESKRDEKLSNELKLQEEEISFDKNKNNISENDLSSSEEKVLNENDQNFNKTGSNLNLNSSGKSDDKTEEDEEDSPTFEPIDIMNLNESNISNDSHLSGISELTSHRSTSPDFYNELSRDNFDYSNQDSQLSKVSSDSRLSIVTDFGSSNHASTPLPDVLKDDVTREKTDVKNTKDNFKAVRQYEFTKNKSSKNVFDLSKNKDAQENKDIKGSRNSLSSKENSRDATDSGVKNKYEQKNSKDRSRDTESKSKSKDKNHVKDEKHHRDKSIDKKKDRSHSNSKYDKYDKSKSKDKGDQPKDSTDKVKDMDKDSYTKTKEDRTKSADKKDNMSKEGKDLKDLYKEKIRELREKKELTEKEKLNKDIKESKSNKENKDKKDSLKDKKCSKKDHKNFAKNFLTNSCETKVRTAEKTADGKERRSESRDKDKSKRDDKHASKDHVKYKSCLDSNKSNSMERLDKPDDKKVIKSDKEEKVEKLDIKKDVKLNNEKLSSKKDRKDYSQSKGTTRNEKLDNKKEDKNDSSQHKDKRRREEKKSKMKDDHSSLRRNSNDRRSTDRDGSNGSSSKSSHSNSSNSNAAGKSNASTFSKETNHMSSSSETSDNIEEVHTNDVKLSLKQQSLKPDRPLEFDMDCKTSDNIDSNVLNKQDSKLNNVNLPLKKRSLLAEDNSDVGEIKVKKPKFARNIHEAKKLMKIRKQIEKQKLKGKQNLEKKLTKEIKQSMQASTADHDNVENMPDEERVQIIEIPDEEYEEPYPEKQTNLTLEERSIMMLQTEVGTKDILEAHPSSRYKLSDMELCISQSLTETFPYKALRPDFFIESCQNVPTEKFDENKDEIKVKEEDEKEIENKFEKDQNERSLFIKMVATENNRLAEQETKSSTLQTQEEVNTSKVDENSVLESNSLADIDEEVKTNVMAINSTETEKIDCLNNEKSMEMPSTSKLGSKSGSHSPQDYNSNVSKNEYNESEICQKQETNSVESMSIDDTEGCRYFKFDNEESKKFSNFLESLEVIESNSLEKIIESLGGHVVSSIPRAMAPPLPKRKHSSSPFTDMLLSNSNNNNDGPRKAPSLPNEEALSNIKKRKLVAHKKQRLQPNVCAPQGLLNGDNFVMPLSPESDVSATSEKIPSSNLIKEDKGRHRSSQRYSSDDLYKPRPLFSSSSRRSRRSNQV